MQRLVLLLALMLPIAVAAQNLPDRIVVLDPLGLDDLDSAEFTLLGSTRLYGEFARYSDASGINHRWNAKTGGTLEIARWDSSTSIALVGTAEVVMDPLNDIAFNPRAIFWEEGALASFRLSERFALQAGYIHRCKHDIDNLEVWLDSGRIEERTLIYSGITTRLLMRPISLSNGSLPITMRAALRNDLFLHLLDSRLHRNAVGLERDLEKLLDALNLTVRLDIRSPGATVGGHLSADVMLSLFGAERGLFDRFNGIEAEVAAPFLEAGLDLVNERGGMMSFFLRAEWQNDGAIVMAPTPASLLLFGVRVVDFKTMW